MNLTHVRSWTTLALVGLAAFGCKRAAAPGPFTREATLARVLATKPGASLPADRLPVGVLAEEDLVYRTVDGQRLELDLYRPRQAGPHPAILIVHGGGWAGGDRRMERPFAKRLAALGYAAAPVSYRLGPAGRFPNALIDLKMAVLWLRQHDREHDIDGTRVAAVGGSAGGQLVALLGATNGLARFDGDARGDSTEVAAVVDIDGLADFTGTDLLAKEAASPGAPTEFLGGPYSARADTWRDASALTHVGPHSAPTLFVNSTAPTPILPGRLEMQRRLLALGIDSAVLLMPNTPHPFWLLDPWFEPTLAAAERFLRSHLRR